MAADGGVTGSASSFQDISPPGDPGRTKVGGPARATPRPDFAEDDAPPVQGPMGHEVAGSGPAGVPAEFDRNGHPPAKCKIPWIMLKNMQNPMDNAEKSVALFLCRASIIGTISTSNYNTQ